MLHQKNSNKLREKILRKKVVNEGQNWQKQTKYRDKTRDKRRQYQRKYREKTTKKKSLHVYESEAEIIEKKREK